MLKLEINKQFQEVCASIAKGESLFVTGKAGTGKSTLLRYISDGDQLVVLSPTGIAALNVNGQTLHSFFNLPHRLIMEKELSFANPEKLAVMKNLKTMIIDEISMVRADILDGIDYILKVVRKNGKPFGGVQVVFFGDLHQLSPIVTPGDSPIFVNMYKSPYFFSARVFSELQIKTIQLTKIYRQSDKKFIDVLNNIREGRCSTEDLLVLNARHNKAPMKGHNYVTLTCTNKSADNINTKELNRLKTPISCYQGQISDNFDSFPAPYISTLRTGAQVIFVKNDSEKRWVNGTIGIVQSLHQDSVRVNVDGINHDVDPVKWEKHEYKSINGKVTPVVVGSYTQIPLKLAWAITIHKGQGQTLENVIIDLGFGTFAHGQLYVALSRCTSLEGMILQRPIIKSDMIFDVRVAKYMELK